MYVLIEKITNEKGWLNLAKKPPYRSKDLTYKNAFLVIGLHYTSTLLVQPPYSTNEDYSNMFLTRSNSSSSLQKQMAQVISLSHFKDNYTVTISTHNIVNPGNFLQAENN